MDQGTTLRHFAKTVVNLSSGLLLARLPIPRSRNVGCVELLLSLGDPAGGRTSAVHHTRRLVPITVEETNRRCTSRIELSPLTSVRSALISYLLSSAEINNAGEIPIQNHQEIYVKAQVLKSLDLNVHNDTEGILRCCGRLDNVEIPEEAKYPIFILQKTTFAVITIQDFHQKRHPGISHTVALVHQHICIPQLLSSDANSSSMLPLPKIQQHPISISNIP
ncbi:hypothetical protein RB195_018924 [Necator americanus]|uniref:Uncharacterized protein n=1 Tax=Necator americanus TaxID=51031 RepID=A0ABR1CFG5_NECAM